MRLFTAIDLPPEIRGRLEDLISGLRPLARIRWTETRNLHITTKFIGQWPDERLPELQRILAGLSPRPPIPVSVSGLGFFPNQKSPHTLWAGIEASAPLAALAHDTNQALAHLVEPEARAYSPHLTLARIKAPAHLQALHKQIERLGRPEFGSFTAGRFCLYLSQPGPAGSVYTKLSEFPIAIS